MCIRNSFRSSLPHKASLLLLCYSSRSLYLSFFCLWGPFTLTWLWLRKICWLSTAAYQNRKYVPSTRESWLPKNKKFGYICFAIFLVHTFLYFWEVYNKNMSFTAYLMQPRSLEWLLECFICIFFFLNLFSYQSSFFFLKMKAWSWEKRY